MPQQQPTGHQTAGAPLRRRLVLGWSLFFVFFLAGLVAAFWVGRAVPVLLDVMAP